MVSLCRLAGGERDTAEAHEHVARVDVGSLGHFALATGLHRALAAEGARVVSVSSAGHHRSQRTSAATSPTRTSTGRGRVGQGDHRLEDTRTGLGHLGAAGRVAVARGVAGRYFEDCNEAAPNPNPAGTGTGVAAYTLDPDAVALLWTVSLDTIVAAVNATP